VCSWSVLQAADVLRGCQSSGLKVVPKLTKNDWENWREGPDVVTIKAESRESVLNLKPSFRVASSNPSSCCSGFVGAQLSLDGNGPGDMNPRMFRSQWGGTNTAKGEVYVTKVMLKLKCSSSWLE
jgi:hypothetical protein